MTVATKTQPNYTTQDAATYKAAIDAITAVHDRLGGAFAAHEQNVGSPSPDLSVRVDAGFVFSGVTLTEVAAQTVSGFTTPSSGQERIDRVVIDASTGVASRVAGTAVSGSPSAVAPAIPAGSLPCCQIRFTDTSTGVLNSMITDERAMPSSQGGFTLGTLTASGSGTSIDFTGIPATAKVIILSLNSVSTNGTSPVIVQLGDAGGIENSGYQGTVSSFGTSTVSSGLATSGFFLQNTGSVLASHVRQGSLVLTLMDASSFLWACQGTITQSDAAQTNLTGGVKALSAALDRIRITTAAGTDAFDGGSINISYL